MRGTISFDLDGVVMQNPFAKGVTPQVREHIRRGLRLKDLVPAEANRQTRPPAKVKTKSDHGCREQQ